MGDHLRAADVLASGMHDAKNRLFEIGATAFPASTGWESVQQQLRDVALRLDRTLNAYRLLNHENIAASVPVFIPHLIEDVLLRCPCPAHLQLTTEVKLRAEWPLSRELVEETLINALQNAGRYARARIHLRVAQENGLLVFEVNDDGPGFGSQVLSQRSVGLYIAERVAELHSHRFDDGAPRCGRLTLDNGGEAGGARFRLELP